MIVINFEDYIDEHEEDMQHRVEIYNLMPFKKTWYKETYLDESLIVSSSRLIDGVLIIQLSC